MPANLMAIMQALLIPVLTLISIPKALNPLQPPLIPIIIPLDPIFKPILKTLIAAIIAELFKLLQNSHDSISKKIEENGGTIEGLTGTNGVFAETTDDTKILKEIFSTVCGLGTSVSVTTNTITTTPGGTTSTSGTESSTSTIFTVSITLPTGRTIHLPTIPFMALDLIQYFHLLTSADIIEFVRQIINSVFDIILEPVRTVVDLIAKLALSVNSFSYNIIEAGIPMLSLIKLAKMVIDMVIPASFKLKIIGTDVMNLIQLVVIPALELVEPVLKQVAWIGTTALCAISSPLTNYLPVSVARMVHPIMNCDDLPPWERLTHKNPLFAIFLDEIAWRGSMYSTGSLIFQTKTPAALPYTPIFPIVHITPHLT
jgi:hypothetical protein